MPSVHGLHDDLPIILFVVMEVLSMLVAISSLDDVDCTHLASGIIKQRLIRRRTNSR